MYPIFYLVKGDYRPLSVCKQVFRRSVQALRRAKVFRMRWELSYWGYIRAILGLHSGYIGAILGLYWGYIRLAFQCSQWLVGKA